nr:putative glycoprotein [Bovine gammaherpesvirus 4]
MYVPWNADIIIKHRKALRGLLENSFLPGTPESALNNPVLIHLFQSLSTCSHCNICQLLYSLVHKHNPNVSFYEDYSLLCFVSLYAPICWTSIFMIAGELAEILAIHFPTFDTTNLYTPNSILGIDIMLHFFIQRCFKPIKPNKINPDSNLVFLKIQFMKSALIKHLPENMCFKTSWMSIIQNKEDTNTCCNLSKSCAMTLHPEIQEVFCDPYGHTKSSLLQLFIHFWGKSILQPEGNWPEIDTPFLFTPQEDSDTNQGPCLLTPQFNLKQLNKTYSVCPLCECLAAHPHTKTVLQRLQQDILLYMDNNVKLVDRISFILKDPKSMPYISDQTLKQLIRTCSPQEVHKHLFCDPLCTINTITTSTDVLFKIPLETDLKKFKALVATGTHLDYNTLFDCPLLETITLVFKEAQITKLGKTTLIEIIKELEAILKKHNLNLITPIETYTIYT